jgi:hypothetical protein
MIFSAKFARLLNGFFPAASGAPVSALTVRKEMIPSIPLWTNCLSRLLESDVRVIVGIFTPELLR